MRWHQAKRVHATDRGKEFNVAWESDAENAKIHRKSPSNPLSVGRHGYLAPSSHIKQKQGFEAITPQLCTIQ
jgi:hypothetical protein